jgi:hypothetical protein
MGDAKEEKRSWLRTLFGIGGPKTPANAPMGQAEPKPASPDTRQLTDRLHNFPVKAKGNQDGFDRLADSRRNLRNERMDIDHRYSEGKIGSHVYHTKLTEIESKSEALKQREAALQEERRKLIAEGRELAKDLTKQKHLTAIRGADPADAFKSSLASLEKDPNTPKSPDTDTPKSTDSKAPKTTNAPAEPVKSLDEVAKRAEELDRKTKELNKQVAEAQKQYEKSQSQADKAKFEEKLKGFEKQRAAIETDFDNLAKKIEAMPGMEGVRGATTGETLGKARERFSKIAGAGRTVATVGSLLVTTFSLLMEIKGILEAKTMGEAVGKTLDLAKGVAVNVAGAGLVSYITKSARAGGIFMLFTALKDNASDVPDPKELAKLEKKETNLAIALVLDERYPGSVQFDGYEYLVDARYRTQQQALEKTVERLRKQHVEKEDARMVQRGREVGIRDGLTGKRLHVQKVNADSGYYVQVEGLDVKESQAQGAALFKGYNAGYQEGEDRKTAALKKALVLGFNDGKAGKPPQTEQFTKWPEVQTSGLAEVEAVARGALLGEILAAYKKAFESSAPASPKPRPGGDMTSGELVARDHRNAAIKRAGAWGLEDGKTGKQARIEEIQKWTEVTELEGTERGKFLHELIEIYNKAFATVAPAGAVTDTGGKLSAGEKVARDKKAAAMKRAWQLGTDDGKTGVKLQFEKIQKWPEVTELEGPARGTFLAQLLAAYTKAFDAVPPKAGPTGGERVSSEKKAEALKRAAEMGVAAGKAGQHPTLALSKMEGWPAVAELQGKDREEFLRQLIQAYSKACVPELGRRDGKAGRKEHMDLIQKWPSVTKLEGAARGAFLHQLLEAYLKAFDEAASANVVTR